MQDYNVPRICPKKDRGEVVNHVISNNNEFHCSIKRSVSIPPGLNKTFFFKFCWWNGGGKVKLRLASNPELRKFLAKKPDIFTYGESETTSSNGLSINGYACYLHKSKLNVTGNFRRGLAIFYLTKYRFLLTKVHSSRTYDIVWMRLDTPHEPIFFCFFYAPGAHHPLPIRSKFYDKLSAQYSRFAPHGKVYLVGDSNARLGQLLNDTNLRGEPITNSNQPLFLEFLQYSGLVLLNAKFCLGVPTYEILNKKRSIIDFGLTNSFETIQNFSIESTPFGVNSQTCHRALTTSIRINPPKNLPITAPRRPKLLRITPKQREDLTKMVCHRILSSENIESLDYFSLSKIFTESKKTLSVGSRIKRKITTASPNSQSLQRRFSDAIATMQKEQSEFSFFVVDSLEKLLTSQYEHDEKKRFSQWLEKMNELDFYDRTRTFFKELRQMHNATQKAGTIFDDSGNLPKNFDETLKNWTEYYKKLYFCCDPVVLFPTPDKDDILDRDLELGEFLHEIYSLIPHKSPGYDGLTSEDFRMLIPRESPEDDSYTLGKLSSLKSFFKILENFWFNESVPRDFKRTLLSPFLKNEDEDQNDPSNYRPISLLNSLMKIYEGILSHRISTFFDNNIISPCQAAYRKNRSVFDHVLVLHEVFLEYRFYQVGPRGGTSKRLLYLCFLDLRKAFDTVSRNILFTKLCKAGIRGKLLRVIRNLFSNNPANVLVNGFLSPEFIINRGVLQGSKLGPILFNLFINDLLVELNCSDYGATVGPVKISALGFADDIVLVSDKPCNLQHLLDICYSWAKKNSMDFCSSKCKVLILNGSPKNVRFTLNNFTLEIVSSYRYLGINLTNKYVTNLFKDHFQSIIEKAKSRAAVIRRYGFSKKGFRVETSVKLYKLLVRPILEFCAQSLTFAPYSQSFHQNVPGGFAKKLEQLQTQLLKSLINCPRSTSPAIIRLFCGTEPLACRLEILKLRYFWRMLHGPADAPSSRILKYRRDRFLEFSNGFARDVFNICSKYNIMHIWHGVAPPGRFNRTLNPLQYIKKIITTKNLSDDLEIGRTKNCAFSDIFLSNVFLYQKKYHIVEPFNQVNCFALPEGRMRFLKALLHPCSYTEACPHCGEEYRDTCNHLLTTCPLTFGHRKKLNLKLTLYNYPEENFPFDKTSILRHVLGNKLWRKCFTEFLIEIGY